MKGCSAARPAEGRDGNCHGPVVQLGVHAALSRRRSRVQIPSGPLPSSDPPLLGGETRLPGRVAQLVERAPEKREVRGSMPRPTTETPQFRGYFDGQWVSGPRFRVLPRALKE